MALGAGVAAFAWLALPRASWAQERVPLRVSPDQMGRVVARLVDGDSGAPITQALVTLRPAGRRTLSDSTGTATFLDVPPGAYEIVVRHIGYGEQTLAVEVGSMTTAIVGAELAPEAVAVAPLEVVVENRPRYLEDQGFYARRARGVGTYFDPQFVDRWNVGLWARASDFMDLIRNMSPSFSGRLGCGGPVLYIDGRESFSDDGRLGGRPGSELDMMSTYMIGAVEVYSDHQGAPDFALSPDAMCGVVALWTNRWRGRTRELGGAEIELCEPEEPGTHAAEGILYDEFTEVLLPGARVIATIYPTGNPRGARSREIVSDLDARYRVCDIPPDHTLTLKAFVADRDTPEVHVPIDAPIVAYDMAIQLAGPGDLVGRVVDRDTGNPVAAADIRVRLAGSPAEIAASARTDELGYFRIEGVRPGDHQVEIAHLGFEPLTRRTSFVADRTVEMQVELSVDPIELEPLIVTALRDRRLERRGYYDRRTWGERTGQGTFMNAEIVERRAAATTSSLLGDAPGLRVRCSGRDCTVGTVRGSCDRMNVYLNGTLALRESRPSGITIDDLVRPSEIEAVEVYAGGVSAPAEFMDGSSRCGAIVIWTK